MAGTNLKNWREKIQFYKLGGKSKIKKGPEKS